LPTTKHLQKFCDQHHIPFETYLKSYTRVYKILCEKIYTAFNDHKNAPFIIGLNGAQGSGKSTLVHLISDVLDIDYGLKTAFLSIDDFYKTQKERQKMARETHSLFATRGVPGTHDIDLGLQTIQNLKKAHNKIITVLPRFNKARDDRVPENEWPTFIGKPDIILFEGWCVGSQPQEDHLLTQPVNNLETEKDPDTKWRSTVNNQLKGLYAKLFNNLDFLILLNAPNFECAFKWRQEQEHKLIQKLHHKNQDISQTMDDTTLSHFMMFYERLTRHNLETLPARANIIINLNKNRHPSFDI